MQDLSSVIAEIYAASHHPDRWNTVMKILCTELIGARSATIYLQDDASGARRELGFFCVQSDGRLFGEGEREEKDFAKALQYCFMLQSPEQGVNSNPNTLGRSASNVFCESSDKYKTVNIMIQAASCAMPAVAAANRMVDSLRPHVLGALRLRDESQHFRAGQIVMQSALSNLALGLIIIGPDNQIFFQNAMADSILAQHKGLSVKRGRVRAYFQADQERLASALALQSDLEASGKQGASHTALALRDPARSMPLSVILAPLTGAAAADERKRGCIALYLSCAEVFSDDQTASAQAPAHIGNGGVSEVLNALYKLSPAESSIAIGLSNGLTVNQISQRNKVTPDTVRSQLKSVFMKMGVNKQQDVIRVLLGGVLSVQQALVPTCL